MEAGRQSRRAFRKASEVVAMVLLLGARSYYEKVDLLQVQERATRDKVHRPAKDLLAYMGKRASRRPAHNSPSGSGKA